jgi:hypothetical protein
MRASAAIRQHPLNFEIIADGLERDRNQTSGGIHAGRADFSAAPSLKA